MAIKLVAHRELCHGCGNCVVACPVNASKSTEIAGGKGTSGDVEPVILVDDGAIKINRSKECKECATCVKACPVGAIALEVVE
ncbi:MAG: 4Fe-4S binding protein [Methanobacterium sp.]|uniref:4Fe-4S binding protein n=1 Tax=Methanobacterium sp. TaxID=2164 RepID=UPI003D65F5E5|nr:4Fe-4S binding protein [Methanobacterium sp.]